MRRTMLGTPYLGLALALLCGLVLRAWHLTTRSPFLDEGWELILARQPISDMLENIAAADYHPPLFYLLAHAMVAALHWPLERYRLLTAPFGALTIIATWAIGRRWFGLRAANIAAFLVALSPTLVDFDRIWRMYSLLTAGTALSWWLLVVADDAKGRKRAFLWSGYILVAALLPSLQYVGAFVLIGQGAYALRGVRDRWPVLAAAVLAALALLPWWPSFVRQYALGGHAIGANGVSNSLFNTSFDVLANGLPVPDAAYQASAAVFSGLALVVLAAGAVLGRGTPLPYWLLSLGLQIVAASVLQKDLLVSRYLLPIIPAFALCAGVFCSRLIDRSSATKVVGIALAVVLGATSAVAAGELVFNPYYQSTDWNRIAAIALRVERADDAFVLDQGYSAVVLAQADAFKSHDVEQVTGPNSPVQATEWIDSRPNVRIWYIENQWKSTDPGRVVLHHLVATRRLVHGWLEQRRYYADRALVMLFDVRTVR